MKKVGFYWLEEKLEIQGFQLTHLSIVGKINKTEVSSENSIIQTFKSKYDVKNDDPISHLEFGLKYDDINFAFLKEVFQKINYLELLEFINTNPNRKYTRIIGFLYEFMGGRTIDIDVTTTNYVDVLDPSKYFVGETKKISKWKVNDNLLGSYEFCPVIRKSSELLDLLEWDVKEAINNLKKEYSPEIFDRASYYLYKKESKSSSEIERESLSADRMDKFIALLEKAGQKPIEESLSEEELVQLQNAIVDPRYADHGFRNFQNYIGQTMRDYSQYVHYVCPPPQFVRSLMHGLRNLYTKIDGLNSIIKATIVSFGYVYIHPFEDGNGRIHRFLIHDILVRDGVVPNSTILPVSAQILAHINEYDATLEQLSDLVQRKAKYEINDAGELTVNNANEIEALYRYPDLTNHAIFLAKSIRITIAEDVPGELLFLQRYDQLKLSIQQIVDMPNKKMDRMIILLHQNNGKLSNRKRKLFKELKEAEINQLEQAYLKVYVDE